MTSIPDTAAFALPPQVAKMDAVRKLAIRLTETLGLRDPAASTVAHAVTDPTAVRNALAEPLPGLTAQPDSHLQVIPTRVWTPWVTAAADEAPRYLSQKVLPVADPTVPKSPKSEETSGGLAFAWSSLADRDWHLKDNRKLYDKDIYADSLRLFPDKGGVVHPLVMVPQAEIFADGTRTPDLLRIADGHRRYYTVQDLLERYASLDEEGLSGHFGPGAITPKTFRLALHRDRAALGKVVNAVRAACLKAGDGNDFQQLVGVHYLATCLSLPAYLVVGTVDPVTSEVRPMGSRVGDSASVDSTLSFGMLSWHTGRPAQLVVTGQRSFNGLMLPEAAVDTDLIKVAARRLQVRGVPKQIIDFGTRMSGPRPAARFVWWCRAIQQLGGTPATAVAAFAEHAVTEEGGGWPESISRPLLACAAHIMEEDRDAIYPPGDYRDAEVRPDSLSLLVSDARNLTPIAALSSDGCGDTLAHPRFRNAQHIALAHLAFIGALPGEQPLPERITSHVHLLSHVALAWVGTQNPVFVKQGGGVHHDADGRPVIIDERTLSRDDLPWPKTEKEIGYLVPPTREHSYPEATHVFKLRHDVVYTIPRQQLDIEEVESTPESIAKVVWRWFPDATAVVLTDWSDKFITGVMVGSVYVRLFDRRSEREDARHRGVWYPEGRPEGTKDVLDFDTPESGAPVGRMLGVRELLEGNDAMDMLEIEEIWYRELDDDIINEVDEALEIQKERAQREPSRYEIPVLHLPARKK